MKIPWEQIKPETQQAILEEFVSRDGTDYGVNEASLDAKVRAVRRALERGKATLVYDPETQTCDIKEVLV
jgi:uncharacterized protein YheU (UPF0270 family)